MLNQPLIMIIRTWVFFLGGTKSMHLYQLKNFLMPGWILKRYHFLMNLS
jgi:hypothetical protein